MENKERIYADNAATTPVSPSVLEAMRPFLTERFGNPSALYLPARQAGRAQNEARKNVAAVLHAKAQEIFFTSGGTEGDNWAVKGTALRYLERNGRAGHIITTAFEHHAVLHAVQAMERLGFAVSYVFPDENGLVRPEDFEREVRHDTCLAAVMLANNEIGTIQPVEEISRRMHKKGIPVLCDAVQALGQIPVDCAALGADMVTFSGHKIHAPKGIGCIYIKEGTDIVPLLDGGGQEYGMRSGTENTAFAVGLAQAVADAAALAGTEKMLCMRERLFDGLLRIPGALANGTREAGERLPGNVNVSFPGLDAESMVLLLDSAGICASAGSACNARDTHPSHVLKAIGRTDAAALSSLRFTLSPELGDTEIDRILAETEAIVCRLRALNGLDGEGEHP